MNISCAFGNLFNSTRVSRQHPSKPSRTLPAPDRCILRNSTPASNFFASRAALVNHGESPASLMRSALSTNSRCSFLFFGLPVLGLTGGPEGVRIRLCRLGILHQPHSNKLLALPHGLLPNFLTVLDFDIICASAWI